MQHPDRHWMERALELAERGRGSVEPNPLVGAVAVRAGQLVGEGWHEKFGQAHAEVNALAMAKEQARGADLYVTLEPCCHHGKTPPCTDAILHAGVARVIAAMSDPFPQVAGKGAELLRAAGIAVEVGLCESEARSLNAPYLTLLGDGRPYVHAKWAMSLDGKIATRTGDSRGDRDVQTSEGLETSDVLPLPNRWISNAASRKRVHELRGRMDAIIVGIGTVLADHPLLTARPPGPRIACRVILDSRGRLPATSQLVRTAGDIPTLVVSRSPLPAELLSANLENLILEVDDHASAIAQLLAKMGRRRWTNVLVEGGSTVLGAFFDAGMIDEVHVFIAPILIGGSAALSPMGGRGAEIVAEGLALDGVRAENIDGDIYVCGKPKRGLLGRRDAVPRSPEASG